MNGEMQEALWAIIRELRIRRVAIRLELRDTPRWKFIQRRRLQKKLNRVVVNLKGALSLAGEPPLDKPDQRKEAA